MASGGPALATDEQHSHRDGKSSFTSPSTDAFTQVSTALLIARSSAAKNVPPYTCGPLETPWLRGLEGGGTPSASAAAATMGGCSCSAKLKDKCTATSYEYQAKEKALRNLLDKNPAIGVKLIAYKQAG